MVVEVDCGSIVGRDFDELQVKTVDAREVKTVDARDEHDIHLVLIEPLLKLLLCGLVALQRPISSDADNVLKARS